MEEIFTTMTELIDVCLLVAELPPAKHTKNRTKAAKSRNLKSPNLSLMVRLRLSFNLSGKVQAKITAEKVGAGRIFRKRNSTNTKVVNRSSDLYKDTNQSVA